MSPELRQKRDDYLVRGMCAVCGGLPHDVHEILAGANRQAAVAEPATWLRVCRTCHDEIQGVDPEYQLAVKLLADPAHFSLAKFCKAWSRPLSAVDTMMLVIYVQTILLERS